MSMFGNRYGSSVSKRNEQIASLNAKIQAAERYAEITNQKSIVKNPNTRKRSESHYTGQYSAFTLAPHSARCGTRPVLRGSFGARRPGQKFPVDPVIKGVGFVSLPRQDSVLRHSLVWGSSLLRGREFDQHN